MSIKNNLIKDVTELADAGGAVDYDNSWGSQCVDLINWYLNKYFGVVLWGNAINLLDSAKQQGWEVHYMPTEANPKAGAVFVTSESHGYGHTGWVVADSDGWTMKTVEQNIDGNKDSLVVGGPARHVPARGFGNVVGWFYPPYEKAQQLQHAPNTVAGFVKYEKGTMTIKVQALKVRTSPDLTAESDTGYLYLYDSSVNYDSVYIANGYVWVSYLDAKGTRRYVAAGVAEGNRNVSKFGTFS